MMEDRRKFSRSMIMIMIKHGPLTLKLYDYDPHVLLENITLTAQCCDIYNPGERTQERASMTLERRVNIITNKYIQGFSKKSVISKFLTFCVIALGHLSSKEDNSCLH